VRFIHTADWQIGKVFRFVDDATMGVLQEARLEAIASLGRLALAEDAASVRESRSTTETEAVQIQRVKGLRASRDDATVARALARLIRRADAIPQAIALLIGRVRA